MTAFGCCVVPKISDFNFSPWNLYKSFVEQCNTGLIIFLYLKNNYNMHCIVLLKPLKCVNLFFIPYFSKDLQS